MGVVEGRGVDQRHLAVDRQAARLGVRVLKHHGGIAPGPRKARAGSLILGEREEISRDLCAGEFYRTAVGGRDAYRATAVQERALHRAGRPKRCLLAREPLSRQTDLTLLKEEWPPEQIVGHLLLHHEGVPSTQITHETSYRSICTNHWKVVPRELCKRLRTGHPVRRNARHTVSVLSVATPR